MIAQRDESPSVRCAGQVKDAILSFRAHNIASRIENLFPAYRAKTFLVSAAYNEPCQLK